jgi:purine-nucleoside phosphorylase
METAELYTLASKFRRKALSVMTVSDHVVLGGKTTAEERQNSFTNMVRIALETIIA